MVHTILLFTCACAALAQSPAFEAASVKPSTSPNMRSSMRGSPGQIVFTNATLAAVVLRVYDLQPYQLSAPDWLSARRYDIVAKVPPGTTRERSNEMLLALLAERFRLAVHREERELAGFALTTARNGPKLKPAEAAGPAASLSEPPKRDGEGYPVLTAPGVAMMEGVRGKSVVSFLTAKAQRVTALVDLLSREFRMPISDQTGLAGTYDFRLEFAPQPPGALPPGALPPASLDADAASEPSAAPNLITAVQQQLGLRLVPAKAPVTVLVVDSADPVPSGN